MRNAKRRRCSSSRMRNICSTDIDSMVNNTYSLLPLFLCFVLVSGERALIIKHVGLTRERLVVHHRHVISLSENSCAFPTAIGPRVRTARSHHIVQCALLFIASHFLIIHNYSPYCTNVASDSVVLRSNLDT